MKVAINKCYGGFGLSPRAVLRICERKGRPCFLFVKDERKPIYGEYRQVTPEQAAEAFVWWAFDIANPNEVLMREGDWHSMTDEQKRESSALYEKHAIGTGREVERNDPDLIAVVEEMGQAASGKYGAIKIVEIPDGIEWVIDEYDGMESVEEAHRSWA